MNVGGWVAVVSVCFCVCARGTVLVSLRGGVGVCGAIGAYVDACTIYQPVRVDTVFVSLVCVCVQECVARSPSIRVSVSVTL